MKLNYLLPLLMTLSLFAHAENKSEGKKMKAQQSRDMQVMKRLKKDIVELKGPPTVADVEAKQKKHAADLMLVIDSGRYSGKRLEYIKGMHERILAKPLPSQEDLNKRHKRNIAMLEKDNGLKERGKPNVNQHQKNNNMKDMRMRNNEMRQRQGAPDRP